MSVVRRNSARLAEVWMDEYKVRHGTWMAIRDISFPGAVLPEVRSGASLCHR